MRAPRSQGRTARARAPARASTARGRRFPPHSSRSSPRWAAAGCGPAPSPRPSAAPPAATPASGTPRQGAAARPPRPRPAPGYAGLRGLALAAADGSVLPGAPHRDRPRPRRLVQGLHRRGRPDRGRGQPGRGAGPRHAAARAGAGVLLTRTRDPRLPHARRLHATSDLAERVRGPQRRCTPTCSSPSTQPPTPAARATSTRRRPTTKLGGRGPLLRRRHRHPPRAGAQPGHRSEQLLARQLRRSVRAEDGPALLTESSYSPTRTSRRRCARRGAAPRGAGHLPGARALLLAPRPVLERFEVASGEPMHPGRAFADSFPVLAARACAAVSTRPGSWWTAGRNRRSGWAIRSGGRPRAPCPRPAHPPRWACGWPARAAPARARWTFTAW